MKDRIMKKYDQETAMVNLEYIASLAEEIRKDLPVTKDETRAKAKELQKLVNRTVDRYLAPN
jgi:hypothetical protein